MRAQIIKIGKSQGVRIPKSALEQTSIRDVVEIDVGKNYIILRPVEGVRKGWDEAFAAMHRMGDDELIIEDQDISHSWDAEEW